MKTKSAPNQKPQEMKKAVERSQIEERFKWDLSPVLTSEEEFQSRFKALKDKIPELEKYQGKIAESGDKLGDFFRLREDIYREFERLLSYARLKQDQDTRVGKYRGFVGQVTDMWSKIRSAVSWFAPELLAIPWEKLEGWMAESEELAVYRHYLEDEFRVKEHILSYEGERLMALASKLDSGAGEIFSAFNNADVGALFPVIKDEAGNEIQLTQGRYSAILEEGAPQLRKDAFQGFHGTYSRFTTTLAAALKAVVERDIFHAQARNYDSALEAALSGDNVPVEVYIKLLEAVHKHLDKLHGYVDLRRKILQLEEIHIYDMHAPLFPEVSEKVDYSRAQKTVMEAMAPLGKDYTDKLKTAFDSRWLDVYENAGKASGAYSWGIYEIHPYVLLNYNETLNDVFTIAHELGHSMHSLLTAKKQPYVYGDYSIFAAEVASTFNEALLMDYLLKETGERLKKLNLLGQYINNFNGTLITQTMFAEFELKIHQMAEESQPLTADTLSEIYLNLLKSYYGDNMTYDELNAINWCRIPHFYYNFYVYKYATSFAAATALSREVTEGEKGAVKRYLGFLASGSIDYPIELLKKAGVDMATPAPVEAAMDLYGKLVEQLGEMV